MKLNFEQIRSITCGAVRMEQSEKGIRPCRFTPEQEELYRPYREELKRNFYEKALASSGVKMAFRTDSDFLRLKVHTAEGTTRSFFDFDLRIDGVLTDTLSNRNGAPYPYGKPSTDYPMGDYEKTFSLGAGEKLVELYFPWSVTVYLQEVELADGASLTPVKKPKTLLIFGDSITQGYDMLAPSNHYTIRLAEALNADLYNKAIGGEVFFPPLAQSKEDLQPDYITVSYGSNDYSKTDGSEFVARCKAFYTALRKKHPQAKIFALTPIWRADEEKERVFGPFSSVEERIRQAVADIPGVTVIRGYDFVPHDVAVFSDLRVHPNDEGFVHFFENLWKEFQKAL